MRIVRKRLSLESRGFRYQVALYIGYSLTTKLKGNPFEFKHNF